MSDLLDPALEDLQESFPSWWNTTDGNLADLLGAWAESLDVLAGAIELRSQESALSTASRDALYRTFAYAWGMEHETLPAQEAQLAAMILARSQEDGSVNSLVTSLLALLLTEENTVGEVLVFPAGGGGFTLPIAPLFQGGLGSGYLVFAADGTGLTFPVYPDVRGMTYEGTVSDGTTPPGAGPGLEFPDNSWLRVTEDIPGFTFEVGVNSGLAFDRGAFARIVERFRPAHLLPPTIIEENL